MSYLMGFKKHSGNPEVYMSGCITFFSVDKNEVLLRNHLELDLHYVDYCCATQHSSRRGFRVNEGHMYMNHRKLARFL